MNFTSDEEKRLTLQNGDLLLCEGGAVGRTALWQGEVENCYYQNHLHRLRIKNESAFPKFVMYWFWHAFEFENFYSGRKNVTTIPNLSKSRLSELPIPVPPLPEQRRIAAILSAVQKAIEEQEELIARTTELKKALMHKLFTEGTRGEPQKETEIGPVPESWEVVRLEKTGDVIYGIQASVANNLEPVGTKILTNKNIQLDGGFDLSSVNYFELKTDRHFNTILQKGDLLFNWRSGSKEHVGKTAYFDLDGEYTHSSFILRIRPKPEINGYFLYYYLNWLRESGYFIKLQTYAVNAKFNKSAINALTTVVPERLEQDDIANALKCVDKNEDLYRKKLAIYQNLFHTLLHRLMTADLRVDDVDLSELMEIGIAVD